MGLTKYYHISGAEAYNKYYLNFYRILRFIGHELPGSYSKRIPNALIEIRNRVKKRGYKVTNTEIHNLARPKTSRFSKTILRKNRPGVYKLSKKADVILEEIYNILKEIETKKKVPVSKCVRGNLEEGVFCRIQMISDLDDKVKYILRETSNGRKREVNEFLTRILDLRYSC